MERSTVRKVIRAASLSLLLAMATTVAGVEFVGASPAMAADQNDPSGNPAQGVTPGQTDPADPAKPANPSDPGLGGLGGIIGNPTGAIGGLGAP